MHPLIAIPVKPFGVAKARLAPVLDADERRRLGKAVAAHTVVVALETGLPTAVVTADASVARWARNLGVQVIPETPELGSGLNGAARAAMACAGELGRPWIVLHADLPWLQTAELDHAIAAMSTGRAVLAPSYNGGTTLLGGTTTDFPFSYGTGSFHRHLQTAGEGAVVVTSPGLVLDLDDPRDLAVVQGTRDWL